MKTNNVASYSDVLVTCMRQNPKWILLSEVRSAEAVSAVRNSISSGHNILSTIHADKASAIPYRLYSLMETDLDVHQFLSTIYRYIQIGVHIKAFYSKEYGKFHREVDEVCEFYVDDNNEPQSRIIYQKQMGQMMMCKPSSHLVEYIENQNIDVSSIIKDLPDELPIYEAKDDFNNFESNNVSTDLGNNASNNNVNDLNISNSAAGSNAISNNIVDGQAESVPVMDNNNVMLASSTVNSLNSTAINEQNIASSGIQMTPINNAVNQQITANTPVIQTNNSVQPSINSVVVGSQQVPKLED